MENLVTIPLERYSELVVLENSVNLLVGRLNRNEFLSREDILFGLNTELSVELAVELLENRKSKIKEEE